MGADDVPLQKAGFEVSQAHQVLVHARRLVHQTVRSATRFLDETELATAKSQLSGPDRRDRFLEAAVDGLGFVAARCRSGQDVAGDLVEAVTRAGQHLDHATRLASGRRDGALPRTAVGRAARPPGRDRAGHTCGVHPSPGRARHRFAGGKERGRPHRAGRTCLPAGGGRRTRGGPGRRGRETGRRRRGPRTRCRLADCEPCPGTQRPVPDPSGRPAAPLAGR